MKRSRWLSISLIALVHCSNEAAPIDPADKGDASGGANTINGEPSASSNGQSTTSSTQTPDATTDDRDAITIKLSPGSHSYLRLSDTKQLTPQDNDGLADSSDWDLAFSGWNIYTNSGPSGPANAAAFGPLDQLVFVDDKLPQIPFVKEDYTGGAFTDWYQYEGGTAHVLWSRYHVYGIKDGQDLWKVQILRYYGDINGAPVPAIYSLRFASLSGGVSLTKTISEIDATAGGVNGKEDDPSGCVNLQTEKVVLLAPSEAQDSSDWHLCFRRDSISVNGGLSGTKGVGAVDIDAAKLDDESLDEIKAKTAESEQDYFVQVSSTDFTNRTFYGDRIISIFEDSWVDTTQTPPKIIPATWVIRGADGSSMYLLTFVRLEGVTDEGPAAVVLKVKSVQ